MLESLPLHGGLIGIEREMLRSNTDATLARTPHPEALGSTFTHPNITIDYGEALIEVVTDAHQSVEAVYQQLLNLHRYCAQNIGDEQLWPVSMPCILPENPEEIEIGYFGESNSGKIKRLYRVGLSHRYGRPMQMIAGVHFNYSPPQVLWEALAEQDGVANERGWRDARYMGMLRNIQRYGWLICHLFGASPAADDSFAPGRKVLAPFGHHTLGWQNATTLRMSQLGYQNKVDFTVRFNGLAEYIHDLFAAVMTPAPAFEYLGLKDSAGNYQQISTHILQISNEYYTAARPKQPTESGELPGKALLERGIAYVELRLLDINPYDPCGISPAQIRFLEVFMLWALLSPSAPFTLADHNELNHNRLRTACCGLTPGIELHENDQPREITDWARELLEQMRPIAERLDQEKGQNHYLNTLDELIAASDGKMLRLPLKVQQDIRNAGFVPWAQALQAAHQRVLQTPLSAEVEQHLNALRDQSLAEFRAIEARPQEDFDTFLAHYFDSVKPLR